MLCFFYIACDVSITLAEQTSTIPIKLCDPLLLVGDMRVIGGADERPLGGLVVEYDAKAPVEVDFADTGFIEQDVVLRSFVDRRDRSGLLVVGDCENKHLACAEAGGHGFFIGYIDHVYFEFPLDALLLQSNRAQQFDTFFDGVGELVAAFVVNKK